jgi:uncharacterized protein YyaL (SSP411 family)
MLFPSPASLKAKISLTNTIILFYIIRVNGHAKHDILYLEYFNMSMKEYKNKLIYETSPYLRQHAHNPVDWYPWGAEAFDRARMEDKPIFLFIGYSTCHWCHVMERESFENEDIAKLLNDTFVSIKVDREERPDIDEVYMNVCQAMTGSGGWPLTILMTPDKKPFFAGTYLPPTSMYGRTGLDTLLSRVAKLWRDERASLTEQSEKLARFFAQENKAYSGNGDAKRAIENLSDNLRTMYDPRFGGFSHAPKFPMPHFLLFLLHEWKAFGREDALDMVAYTLGQMARGGIYDHVGGGFSRYSTDARWLVPHFEKMLYDNALLLRAYVEMFAIAEDEVYGRIAVQTAEYLMRDMQSSEGGYYSAEDADSEGVEGKFYVWDEAELSSLITPDELERLRRRWGVSAAGNFEGKTILNRIGKSDEPDDHDDTLLKKLYDIRIRRVPPFKDKKISASWNGFAIEGMVRAGVVLGKATYIESARQAADFVLERMANENGLLCGTYLEGPGGPAFLSDWANMTNGLLSLFDATRNAKWLKKAKVLAAGLIERFADKDGFCMTQRDAEALLTVPRDIYDGAIPSGSACSVIALQRLSRLTGEDIWQTAFRKACEALTPMAESSPPSHAYLIIALMHSIMTPRQIIITSSGFSEEAANAYNALTKRFDPFTTVIWYDGNRETMNEMPELKAFENSKPFAAYVCENFSCRQPEYSVNAFLNKELSR